MENDTFFFIGSPVGLDCKIYRYMDVLELLAILEGSFSVSQKGNWMDKRESGDIQAAMFLSIANQPVDKNRLEQHKEFCKRIFDSKDMYASCWTMNEIESMLMWQAYTMKRHGVLIESTVGDFIQSLKLANYSVMCAPIQYTNKVYQGMDYYETLFTKTPYYKDERELRFYFEPKSNGLFHIDPERMIKKVILNPFLNLKSSKRIEKILIASYPFLKGKVCNSKMILSINK